MARRHLAVALLPPPSLADEVDVLRRALGSSSLARIPPHLTLVPPVNVREEDLPALHGILAAAATTAAPFDLRIGPVSTFAPRTPTIHLEVGGVTAADAAQLRSLRERLLDGPLDRPEQFAFTPHVTLDQRAERERIDAAVVALSAVERVWQVRSLHLLEHRRPERAAPYWEPTAEVPFGVPHVVGRGGVELRMQTLGMLGDELASILGLVPVGPYGAGDGSTPLVVAASVHEAGAGPCGAAVGELLGGGLARLTHVVVAREHRGVGVGAQLLAAWSSEAAARGAGTVLAAVGEQDEMVDGGDAFLARHGFVAVGGVMVRR